MVLVLAGLHLAMRSTEPRVDERTHYEQILAFQQGDYTGTVSALGGLHLAMATLGRLTGHSEKEDIRLYILLISMLTIFAFRAASATIGPDPGVIRTLQFVSFPQLFPFWFLIYTDVFSLMWLLLALLALIRDRSHLAGLLGIVSMGVRQTNVVWLACMGVWTVIAHRAETLRELAPRLASFAVGGLLFTVFVVLNGGIAVGDPTAHPAFALHTENLLYMLFCFFLLFLPLNLSKLPQIARLHPALLVGVVVVSFALFFGTFRVDHPYNTQWQDVFLRNAILEAITASAAAGVVASLAIALAVLSLCVIRLRRPVHYLVYPFAVLSVLPSWLIEQRYYIPTFALFMLFRESASLRVERATLAVNALLALYLFTGVTGGWFFL